MAPVIARLLEICQAIAEAGVQALVLKEVCLLPAHVRLLVSEAKLTPTSPDPFRANGRIPASEAELNPSSAPTSQAAASKVPHTLRALPLTCSAQPGSK